MSEYWKSTPKYECRYCKIFVKETKLERTNHENSPRHQGNLKRALRDLHKQNEQAVRDKQAAKDEVARLNGVTATDHRSRRGAIAPVAALPISDAENKQRLAQLAELGVAVPQEYRGGLALAGEWETVEVTARPLRRIEPEDGTDAVDGDDQAEEEDEKKTNGTGTDTETKPDRRVLDRKRKFKVELEDDELDGIGSGPPAVKRAWTAKQRTYPGLQPRTDEDLDDLLSGSLRPRVKSDTEPYTAIDPPQDVTAEIAAIKQEAQTLADAADRISSAPPISDEDVAPETLLFRPRRPKPMRPRGD